jgi:hypothetical protein
MADPTAAPIAEVVASHRFELRDRKGALRAVLGELPNPDDSIPPISGLCLFDAEGRQRAYLCLDWMGPSLVFDLAGNNALHIGVRDSVHDATVAGTFVHVTDASGMEVLGFDVSEDGHIDFTVGGRAA